MKKKSKPKTRGLKSRMGRPPVEPSTAVLARFTDLEMIALDKWCLKKGISSRPQALKKIVLGTLGKARLLKKEDLLPTP